MQQYDARDLVLDFLGVVLMLIGAGAIALVFVLGLSHRTDLAFAIMVGGVILLGLGAVLHIASRPDP